MSNWQEAEAVFEHDVIDDTTIPRTFEESAERNADRPAQRYKGGVYDRSMAPEAVPAAPDGEYATLTYGEMRDVVRNLAAGFRELGVGAGDRVGIFADTRMEWAQADFALLAAGGVVTTVYSSSSPAQVRYLLDDPGATGVVVENEELLDRVLEVRDALGLGFVAVMDELDGEYSDVEDVYTLGEVHARGRERYDHDEYQSWIDDVAYEDLATLVYTSGTTGQPKGVKLTHRNLRSNVNQVFRRVGPRPDKGPDVPTIDAESRVLSYLPLAHIYERTAGHFLMFAAGACVAYAESPDTLREDLPLVRPDGLNSVPRIFEKIYDGIREQASESPIKERIFEWAVDVGRSYHERASPGVGLRARMWLANRLVFDKVREGLGGNVELFTSGGGTLSSDLCALYHGMGLPIYEGYGLTETSPVVTSNPPEEPKIGTIGPPVHDVELEVDTTIVPEGELAATMGETGELLVQGPNVFEGYWNGPDETEAAFTEDEAGPASSASGISSDESDGGCWFRTGDIVTIRPDGYLVFHERSKQILVLSTGKNVAPQPIEEALADSDVIDQAMVLGDSRKYVSALIVPDFPGVAHWAERNGVELPADPQAVCDHERVRERVQRAVDEANEAFESHERVGDFRLVPEEFTVENDLLTPSLKKKRRNIREAYADEIASIYDEDDEPAPEAESAEAAED